MPLLQQATDGRMLHRMWRGLRPEPMNCKHCRNGSGEEDVCEDCWYRLYEFSHPWYEGNK